MISNHPRLRGLSIVAKTLLCTAVSLLVSTQTGCIHDQIFQPVQSPRAIVVFSPPTHPPTGAPTHSTNITTVEFNNDGDVADRCPAKSGHICQLEFAKMSIREARRQAAGDRLVVLAFIHGNRNNASAKYSDNFRRFQPLIDCLNMGTPGYDRTRYKDPIDCDGILPPDHVHYVGVYLGWRARTNKPGLDLRQGEAMKLGRKPGIVHVLTELRSAAKDDTTANPSRFVVVGHSFGGLILEQAALQIFEKAYSPSAPNHADNLLACNAPSGPARGYKPFTDLMVTLNAAVNGVPAKHLIDFMQAQSNFFCRSSKLAPTLNRPLLIAIHADSDALTGKLGSYARYIVFPPGGTSVSKFDPPPGEQHPPHAYTVIHSSPANLTYFDNLCYVNKGNDYQNSRTGNRICDRVAALSDRSTDRTFGLAFPLSRRLQEPLGHLYMKLDDDCKTSQSRDRHDTRPICTTTPASDIDLNLPTWNRSPYWLFNVPNTVISGHDNFWTSELISLLSDISVSFDVLKMNDVLK